jgi:hypothetical protein
MEAEGIHPRTQTPNPARNRFHRGKLLPGVYVGYKGMRQKDSSV